LGKEEKGKRRKRGALHTFGGICKCDRAFGRHQFLVIKSPNIL